MAASGGVAARSRRLRSTRRVVARSPVPLAALLSLPLAAAPGLCVCLSLLPPVAAPPWLTPVQPARRHGSSSAPPGRCARPCKQQWVRGCRNGRGECSVVSRGVVLLFGAAGADLSKR